ncbi:MAG: M48 family metallopeptidase [Candidatus Nanoarchaeia archaeon]|nr:M48 family metallopeptidase [Candidatus Nanoarchaeia archaeon]
MNRTSFYEEIRRNKIKSYFLLVIVFLVLLSLVYTISLVAGPDYFFMILIFGTIFSIFYVLISYNSSSKIVLASVKAIKAEQEQFKTYHNLVEGLCLASGLEKPKLYVMKDSQINAFASGKNPKEAIICVTTGALEKLTKQELEGVLSHELSHIANYDIRFMSLVAVLVGLISIISQIFLRSLFFGVGSSNRSEKNNVIYILIALALAIISPLIVALVQLAISRKREYLADSSAVKFVRSPTGLIGALQKIKQESKTNVRIPDAISPLFLVKPYNSKELFQTHPDINKRIELLKKM